MIVIQKEVTDEGEVIPYHQSDLECGSEIDGSNDRVFMVSKCLKTSDGISTISATDTLNVSFSSSGL